MYHGIRGSTCIVTTRKRSCGKVMILHLSVILFTGGGISVHEVSVQGASLSLGGSVIPPCGKERVAVSPARCVPCHACPPPAMHDPLPRTPPSNHTHMSPTTHTPCHTCPLCHTCPHHACTHLPSHNFVCGR